MLGVVSVTAEFWVVDVSKSAGVENPCESLSETNTDGEDEDPEGGLGRSLTFSTCSSSSSWEGSQSEESEDLEDSNDGEDDIDEADSAFQEWDQLALGKVEESNVQENPAVSNDEAGNWGARVVQAEWNARDEETSEGEDHVGKSEVLWVFVVGISVHYEYL